MNNPLENNFVKTLASFKATLTQDESEDFRFATLDDLKQTVAEIQEKQGSAKRLQNLRRLDAFLEAMEQYDKVVQIFLNAADLLAFIWGPAKFMLMTASTWSESFNTLLDAYEEIGDHIPLLKQYEDIMKRSPELRIVLELIYKDILNFHQRAIKHFKNKVWKQLFHATWKTFRTDFQAVLKSLQSHKRLLDSQGIVIGLHESQRVREQIENERQARQKDEETRRRREVITWLAAANSAEDQETAAEARSQYPTTGHWILRETLVAQWCDPHSQTEPCLWINGKPGAGKTILTSILVEECANISNTNVTYFYCRAEDCNRNTLIGVCRSLICQLAQRDTSVLSYVYEMSSSSGRSQLDSMSLAKDMLDVVFSIFNTLFIIIDGIDECKKLEKERISSTLISISERHAAFPRCCFISQHDKDTGKIFRNIPTFRITEKHNKGDILDYCMGMEERIASYFHVSTTDLRNLNISRNVATKADGMFLLAKLVMENLLQQCTRADLEAEIERIPPDLDKAYSRLLSRILDDAPLPEQRVAKRLLCWLLCTQRPLKWHEIQGAMSIDTEKLAFDYRGRSLIKDSKTFCGSLIEVRKGGTIELVHQTARNFLLRQEKLQLALEEVKFTCICLGDLTLPSHDNDNSEDSIRGYIQEGYYGLSDYSVVYWQEHLNKIIRGKALDNEDSFTAFNTAIRSFLSRRFSPDAKPTDRGARSNSYLDRFTGEAFYPDLLQAMAHTNTEQGSLSNSNEDCQPVVAQLLTVREIMERVVLEADSSLQERLQVMYGRKLFKCPEPRCKYFYEGFSIASERDVHTDKHRRAFFCSYPGCPSELIGLTTSTELIKHNVDYHGALVDKESFPWNDDAASIDIIRKIKEGNLSAVQAWGAQWESKIPMKRLWFIHKRTGFNGSPLGLAVSLQNREIFEALLSQAPEELFEPISKSLKTLYSLPGDHLFDHTLRSDNEKIVATYLRRLGSIGAVWFTLAFRLGLDGKVITLLLDHAVSCGDKAFKDESASYLKAVVRAEHDASARYLLFDLGLLEEAHVIAKLASSGSGTFLGSILPADSEAVTMSNPPGLHQYCETGDSREVANLLEMEHTNPNVFNALGYTPLILAIRNGHQAVVRQLLDDQRVIVDAHLNSRAFSALHWALLENQPGLVETFLDHAIHVGEVTRHVRINGVGTTAIVLSQRLGLDATHLQLQRYLEAHTKWSLYSQDSTMLIRFCAAGDLRLVQKALQRFPQELNTSDRGLTPFLRAVKCGQHQVVQFLLEKGCDTRSSEEPKKISALMFAVMMNDLEMVRILLSKARMDPSYENAEGKTALDYLEPGSTVEEEILDAMKGAMDLASV